MATDFWRSSDLALDEPRRDLLTLGDVRGPYPFARARVVEPEWVQTSTASACVAGRAFTPEPRRPAAYRGGQGCAESKAGVDEVSAAAYQPRSPFLEDRSADRSAEDQPTQWSASRLSCDCRGKVAGRV